MGQMYLVANMQWACLFLWQLFSGGYFNKKIYPQIVFFDALQG